MKNIDNCKLEIVEFITNNSNGKRCYTSAIFLALINKYSKEEITESLSQLKAINKIKFENTVSHDSPSTNYLSDEN